MFPIRDTIPSRRLPVVMWMLVALNALAFAYELTLPHPALERLLHEHGLVPLRLTHALGDLPEMAGLGAPLSTLLTSTFLHGGWLHVIFNLWTLLIFGDNVEDRMGRARFLVFYLLCGVLAGAAHVAFNAGSAVPTIGASGAIAGVMGAYLVLFPGARVITLVPVFFYPLFVELPAFVFLLLWFAGQVLSSTLAFVAPEEVGGIAFLAHVGGFVAGVLLHWLFLRPGGP
jgi:membrane associated rhomboid family serine protease